MALALEDVETSFGADDGIAEKKNEIVRREGTNARRADRGHLPLHLPREEVVIEPEAKACPPPVLRDCSQRQRAHRNGGA